MIVRHRYSWEETPRRRKRWFLRWWILLPVLTLGSGALAFLALYGWIVAEYSAKAEAFDLLKIQRMESASVILDRNGQQIGKIFIQNRLPVPYDLIPRDMVHAVIAEEDNRFFDHHGVDYLGILRAAVWNYMQGRVKQGASTVTQQLARNSFDLHEKSYRRKLLEMFLAKRIEENIPKEKIMELYLNRVYFGGGFYGVEAAARGYFGKPAKDLSAGECAMLAGLLKSPNALSPWNNPKGALRVRDFVLARMREMKLISREEYSGALQSNLNVRKRINPNRVSYAMDLVRQQAIAALGFERAMNEGVTIRTTFDARLQQTADQSLRKHLLSVEQKSGYGHPTYEQYRAANRQKEEAAQRGEPVTMPAPGYLQGAVLAVDNATGGILALSGGRDFLHSEYNRAVQGRRPPGTAFTPFVAAAAYARGIFPGEPVDDACIDNRFVMIGGESGILGEWGVERADNEYEGPMPNAEAVSRGKNAAVVRLGFRTGLDDLGKFCAAAGIRSPLRDVANAYLGSGELTLDELTLAYTCFPGGGSRPARLFTISCITGQSGEILYENKPERVTVIPAAPAWQVHSLLTDSLTKTCAREIAASGLRQDAAVAGKPGTSYGFTDTWFVGYSPAVTCGVWVGFDKPAAIFRGAFGKDLALPVWAEVMKASLGLFPGNFPPAPPVLKSVKVCRSSGLLPAKGCLEKPGMLVTEYAAPGQEPSQECDIHGAGVRNSSRDVDQAEWPRAAAAVDLSKIRPIAVTAPTLLAQNDAYRSVNPALQADAGGGGDPSVKVARATTPDGKDPLDPKSGQGAATKAAVPALPGEPEVRRAEPAGPMDLPAAPPVITIPAPLPARF